MMQAIRAGVMQNLFIPELPSEEEIQQLEEKERELQHAREAAAKEVHATVDVSDDAEPQTAMEGLNRQARRMQQQAQAKGQDVSPRKTDYPAQSLMNAPGSRSKKDDARKKQKAARKDRKRAR